MKNDTKTNLKESVQLTKKKIEDRGTILKQGYDELRDTKLAELDSLQSEVLK